MWPHRGLAAALIAAAVALSIALSAPATRADGDPASDVLAQQSLFLPQDAGLTARAQAELTRLVGEASAAGYPVKVAVIASSTDLGSVTALWQQPQLYARFLAQELSLVGKARLIVVMPAGVGATVIGPSRATAAQQRPPAALAGLRPSATAGLGAVSALAVERLAATAGIRLSTPAGAPTSAAPASDPAPWIAFVLGAFLIAVAWGVSLKARPPGWWRTGARAAEPPAAR